MTIGNLGFFSFVENGVVSDNLFVLKLKKLAFLFGSQRGLHYLCKQKTTLIINH